MSTASRYPPTASATDKFTAYQLKIIQESITLVVFVVFAYLYLGEAIRWNHVASFGCIMAAVVLAFR